MSNPDSNTTRNVTVGPGLLGFCVLASITLAILKLTNVWAITWFIVLLPTIVGFGFTILMVIIAIALMIIVTPVQGK